jgi:hypothetical protein
MLVRERAMVLGAVLHHDGKACDGGGLGGSDDAIKLKRVRSYNLSAWKHLGNSEGQFGAAYKGSLINLGVFKTDEIKTEKLDGDEVDGMEIDPAIEIRELSSVGKRLAETFQKSVRTTSYVSAAHTTDNKVNADVLAQFGKRAGLCEIGLPTHDRAVLRDVFFARSEDLPRKHAQQRRADSLSLIMECVERALAAGTRFDNASFADYCYYGALVSDDDPATVTVISAPPALADIFERWRIFYIQGYLAVALQSLLVGCVRAIRAGDTANGEFRWQPVHATHTKGGHHLEVHAGRQGRRSAH